MMKDIEKLKLRRSALLSDAMLVVDQGGGEIALVVIKMNVWLEQ